MKQIYQTLHAKAQKKQGRTACLARTGLFTVMLAGTLATVAHAQNLGFENGSSGWQSSGVGSWSVNSNTANIRSGAKSLEAVAPGGTTYNELRLTTGYSVEVPASGSYYVTIVAYAKGGNSANDVAVGAYNNLNGTKVRGTSYSVSTNAFQRISYTFRGQSGATYTPMLYAKKNGSGTGTAAYFDDVVIYRTESPTTPVLDVTPPTAAERIMTAPMGTELPFNWTPGYDTGSGISGALVLRKAGLSAATPTPLAQTYYSPDPAMGPTTISGWEVVSNDTVADYALDDPGAMGDYTYLVYMRDAALNYSAAARSMVINDQNRDITLGVTSTLYLDGLHLPATNKLTIPVGMNFVLRGTADIAIAGYLVNRDNMTIQPDAVLTFEDGSTYEHQANQSLRALPSANWSASSTCLVTGITSNAVTNLSQAFGRFVWNCPSQTTTNILFTGATFNGNFELQSTGTGSVSIGNSYNNFRGDYLQTGGILNLSGTNSEMIFNGTGLQNFQVSGGSITGTMNLTLNNGNQIRLQSNLVINGHLKLLNGTFNQNGKTLTLASGAQITKGSGSISSTSYPVFMGNNDVTYLTSGTAGRELPYNTTSLRNLNINCSGTVTIAANIWVNGNLNFVNGKIAIGNRNLTLSGTSQIVGYSGARYVVTNGVGMLKISNIGTGGQTGQVWFPIGRSSLSYTPVAVTNTGVADEFAARVIDGVYFNYTAAGQPAGAEIAERVVRKTYLISEAVPGGSDATLTVQWNAGEEGEAFNMNQSYLAHYNGSNWEEAAPTPAFSLSATTRQQTRSNVSSFSPFAVGDFGSPLPVQLVSFQAKQEGTNAVLSWSTATEEDNAYFEVQRSTDAKSWATIGKVTGNGTTSRDSRYSFTDERVALQLQGTIYYRLRQVDFSGKSEYSPVALVRIQQVKADLLTVTAYQAASRTVQVQVAADASEQTTLLVLDIKGSIISSRKVAGSAQVELDLANAPVGTYAIMAVSRSATQTQKIVAY